ncbi:PREDICTED: glucose dehydrogenase [FAD, quinone]-like [Nicrophorus vespilloides]|uniref:Glucose dehydrogenase [FAD, quinone]-like n=1 Tax=Nicrophorus vespilloides TaxID=110193 RepID=A0ABM1MZK6_NICVS|nr:PREDICTED: glucose dehydrogenase [FAD, quinone]-like [Nicrophorus vespilloides]
MFEEQLTGFLGHALLQLISVLSYYNYELATNQHFPDDFGPMLIENPKQNFDFIIIGAGTSGCLIANRLSEVKEWNVLLLEAGTDPTSTVEVPTFFDRLKMSEEDWKFSTTKEKNACLGMLDTRCRLVAGKMLGGDTGISPMHYERAFPEDFTCFNESITYEEALVHYNNIENFVGIDNVRELGTGGDLTISKFGNEEHVRQLIYNAAEELEYTKISAALQNLGYYDVDGYIKSGSRNHFAKAFLDTTRNRKNLFVVRNALVTKIIGDEIDNRVRGVEVYVGKTKLIVKSRIEVILSAGPINSAKLLLLSGFGPKEQLKYFNIPLKANIAVGKNMQDHIAVPIFIKVNSSTANETDFADATYQFLKLRKGPFTQINIHDLVGSINTCPYPSSRGNIKIYHYHFFESDGLLRPYLEHRGFVGKIMKSIIKANTQSQLLVMIPTLVLPKSVGEVTLQSPCPFDAPKIQGNYLSEEDDLESLTCAFVFVERLLKTKALSEIDANFLHVDIPNCRSYKVGTLGYIKCYIENMGMPLSHISGTVQYGNCSNCDACVDDKMRIRGIRHLRVVDASVIPKSISQSLEATVAMLADRAAADILRTWGK